jgi:hypothetical protein
LAGKLDAVIGTSEPEDGVRTLRDRILVLKGDADAEYAAARATAVAMERAQQGDIVSADRPEEWPPLLSPTTKSSSGLQPVPDKSVEETTRNNSGALSPLQLEPLPALGLPEAPSAEPEESPYAHCINNYKGDLLKRIGLIPFPAAQEFMERVVEEFWGAENIWYRQSMPKETKLTTMVSLYKFQQNIVEKFLRHLPTEEDVGVVIIIGGMKDEWLEAITKDDRVKAVAVIGHHRCEAWELTMLAKEIQTWCGEDVTVEIIKIKRTKRKRMKRRQEEMQVECESDKESG